MRQIRSARRAGFTVLELTVVLLVIVLVAALLIPAIQYAREASNRTTCQNNLRQLGLAAQNFVSVKGGFPPLWSYSLYWYNGQQTGSLSNWTPYLLPYLDESNLADQYNINIGFYQNSQTIATPLKMLQCPSAPHSVDLTTEINWSPSTASGNAGLAILDPYFTATFTAATTDYSGFSKVSDQWRYLYPADTQALTGVLAAPPLPTSAQIGCWLAGGTVPLQAEFRRPAQVTDGLAYSVLFVEEGGRPQLWELGKLADANPVVPYCGWADPGGEFQVVGYPVDDCVINCYNNNGIYSFHVGGANFPFGDGSVRFVSTSVGIRPILAMLTASAGDIVGVD